MAISNYTLTRMAKELKSQIQGAKISKIVKISNLDFSFFLYAKSQESLIVSLDPVNPYVLVSSSYFPMVAETKSFTASLKKYFEGGTIIDFTKLPNDKVFIFTIKKVTASYQTLTNKLVISLIPRQTNAIILDMNDTIIDAMRKTSLDDPHPIFPNMHYIFSKNIDEPLSKDDTLETLKYKTIKAVYNEIEYRFNLGEKMEDIIKEIQECKNYYVYKQDITSLKLKSHEECKEIKFNEIPLLYLAKEEEKYKKDHYDMVYHVVSHKLKGLRKKLINLSADLKKAESKKDYVEIGNLLYMHQDEYIKGMDHLNVDGLEIKLDSSLTLVENANAYFKQYQKSKTALEQVKIQEDLTKEKIEYFEKIEQEIKFANPVDMEEIIQELKNDNYLPKDKTKQGNGKKKKSVIKVYNPHTIIAPDGCKISFGISSYQNDYLTFTLARKDDYFLHVKDAHGPHVIIFDNNPSEDTLLLASEIALYYAGLEQGEIYLADKKDVKKIPGKLGKVAINKYQVINLPSIRESSKTIFNKHNNK